MLQINGFRCRKRQTKRRQSDQKNGKKTDPMHPKKKEFFCTAEAGRDTHRKRPIFRLYPSRSIRSKLSIKRKYL